VLKLLGPGRFAAVVCPYKRRVVANLDRVTAHSIAALAAIVVLHFAARIIPNIITGVCAADCSSSLVRRQCI
jgi:hypothetical protein